MTEIGSFFEYKKEFFNAKNNIFADDLFFRSGREALRHLIDYFKIKIIYLPSYFCDDVTTYLKKIDDLRIKEYPVDEKFKIKNSGISKIKNNKKTALLLMDFFGHRDPGYSSIIKKLKKKGIAIFTDRTHSFLNSYNQYFDAEFGSIRKLLINLPGAYLRGIKYNGPKEKFNISSDIRLLKLKAEYLENPTPRQKSIFLASMRDLEGRHLIFKKYNTPIDAPDLIRILKRVNLKKMKNQRIKNYFYLAKCIKSNKKFKICDIDFFKNEAPAYLLIRCKSNKIRNDLRKWLIKNDIYPPIHWPNRKKLSKLLLSITIDHRYSRRDMFYVGRVINSFI